MKIMPILFAELLLVLSLYQSISAEDGNKKFVGDWSGKLKVGATELSIIFHINSENNLVKATMDSPDQGAFGIEVDDIVITGDSIFLSLTKMKASFSGELNDSVDELKGDWKQAGRNFPITLAKSIGTTESIDPEQINFTSVWEGALKVSAFELKIVFKFYTDDSGALQGFMDSPDQGAKNIRLTDVILDDKKMNFKVPAAKAGYEGEISGDSCNGLWNQSGQQMSLNVKKVTESTETKRPQTPKPPFPYKSEDVKFYNEDAEINLAGTLTYPESEGPFPAVVMVSGSGAQDRDETIFNHKPFFVIADWLTSNGIAVLRFDDRGTAESGGSFTNATTVDFATDAYSAVKYLESRNEINKNRIGIVGHSEGGLIAPMIAAEHKDIAFVVLLGGPGLPGYQVLKTQGRLVMESMGEDEEMMRKTAETNEKIYNVLLSDLDSTTAVQNCKKIFEEFWQQLPDEEKSKPENNLEVNLKQLDRIMSPWFRFFLSYDPRPALEKLTIPVLAINGDKDLQVYSKENLPEIEKALIKAGNTNYKILELPKINHILQESETGAVSEYSKIEHTVAQPVLDSLTTWVLNVTK